MDFEVKSKRKTIVVKNAIHRNEVTEEVEPNGFVNEYLDHRFKPKLVIASSKHLKIPGREAQPVESDKTSVQASVMSIKTHEFD